MRKKEKGEKGAAFVHIHVRNAHTLIGAHNRFAIMANGGMASSRKQSALLLLLQQPLSVGAGCCDGNQMRLDWCDGAEQQPEERNSNGRLNALYIPTLLHMYMYRRAQNPFCAK